MKLSIYEAKHIENVPIQYSNPVSWFSDRLSVCPASVKMSKSTEAKILSSQSNFTK